MGSFNSFVRAILGASFRVARRHVPQTVKKPVKMPTDRPVTPAPPPNP